MIREAVWPWPHKILSPAMPPEDYVRIREHLPPLSYYRPLAHRDSDRRMFIDLHPKALRFAHRLPPGYVPPIMRAAGKVMRRFPMFGSPQLGTLDAQGYWRGLLVRDLPGYEIKPHTDAPDKLFSVIVYLKGCEGQGTVLHRPDIDGRTDGAPNTGIAFYRTEDSVHSVPPTTAVRDLLILTVYDREHWRDSHPNLDHLDYRNGPCNPFTPPWKAQ